MPSSAYGTAPDKTWLERAARKGWTQQRMAEEWATESGYSLTRSAIAMAMKRHEVAAARPRPRYPDLLPWKVKDEHRMCLDARMLRIEARIRRGEALPSTDVHWHRGWRERLETADAVIHYDPDTAEGFFWVPRAEGDQDIIRHPHPETVEPGNQTPPSSAR